MVKEKIMLIIKNEVELDANKKQMHWWYVTGSPTLLRNF